MPFIIKRIARKVLTPWLWDHSSVEFQCGHLTFSQFGEDVLSSYFFRRDYQGFYVDIGAFHPLNLSNTYNFYRNGWRGICVDANADVAALFARFRPKDKFVHSAVGGQTGHIQLAMFQEATFNCLAEHLDEVPEEIRRTARLVDVPIRTLAGILEENKVGTVDFLNVDCEGNDLTVLRSNDWQRWQPRVICVEDHAANWQQSEIVNLLSSAGYILKYRAAFSSIFIPDRVADMTAASRDLTPIV